MLLKKSSCVFLPASFILASVIIASVCIQYIYVYFCMNQKMSMQHNDNNTTLLDCSLTSPKPERRHTVLQRHSHFSLHQRRTQQKQPHRRKQQQQQPHRRKQQQQPHRRKQRQQPHWLKTTTTICEFLGTIFQLNNKPLF